MFLRIIASLSVVNLLVAAPLDVVVTADTSVRMPFLCVVEQPSQAHTRLFVYDYVVPLIGATQQFDVTMLEAPSPQSKSDIAQYAQDGYALALFISGVSDDEVSWRLYDTMSVEQLRGKVSKRGAQSHAEWAISLVDSLWSDLTSQMAPFCSLIAACKQAPYNRKRVKNELFLIHPFFDVHQFSPIKLASGHNLAPRWHATKAVIFYSQHTPFNVRLMSVDSAHAVRTIMNQEGQNMTPTIAKNGRVVLSISDGDQTKLYEYHFDHVRKKSLLKCLTAGRGDYISPSFIDDHRVVFCRVDEQNQPSLGILNIDSKAVTWLAVGHALSPSASPDGKRIAYCKRIDGWYQLFVCDVATHKERQLTHDESDKDECSWSPCGNFLVCSVETARSSRIAVVDVARCLLRSITPANQHWSYPCWSPLLQVPFVF